MARLCAALLDGLSRRPDAVGERRRSSTGYITVGLYDDGTPGELFITMATEGGG